MSRRRVAVVGLENDLNGAWMRGEMDIQYQPEFNLKRYSLVCFEAPGCAWNHPTLGSIPPPEIHPDCRG